MGLSVEEQEITISKSRNDKEFCVYITDRAYKTKIEKLGIEPYKIDRELDGEEAAWHYMLPKNQLSFRQPPKKREFTEEQKEELRIRLKNARESQGK